MADYIATEKDVAVLNAHGYVMGGTVKDAQAFIDKFGASDLASYKAEVATFRPSSKEVPTVTMFLPKRVQLNLDPAMVGTGENQFKNKVMVFEAGVQEIPAALATHRWFADNGAVSYTGQPINFRTATSGSIKDENRPKVAPPVKKQQAAQNVNPVIQSIIAKAQDFKKAADTKMADKVAAVAPKPVDPPAPASTPVPPADDEDEEETKAKASQPAPAKPVDPAAAGVKAKVTK